MHYPQLLQVSSAAEASPKLRTPDLDSDPSDTTTLASRAPSTLFSQASVSSAPTSIRSSGSSLQVHTPNTFEHIAGSQGNDASPRSIVVRRACRFDCFCSCHPKSEEEHGSMSSLIKSFARLGTLTGNCDDPRCQSGRSVEEKTTSTSRIFLKALLNIMSAHSVKVRFHLNTFHMVPESSDVMRYAKQGSLDSLKLAIESGAATLWDTAPDGWSLLHVSIRKSQTLQA